MLSGDDIYLAYSRKTVWLIAAAIALSVVVAAAFVFDIASTQDHRAAQQSQQFVRISLAELEKGLNRSLLDNADWGAAYTHLHVETDQDWAFAQNNLGRSTATDLGVDLVAVIGPEGRQTYGLANGELTADAVSSLSGGIGDLLARAKLLQPREIANAVLSADGTPVLAAAAILSTGGDQTVEPVAGPPSVLVFGVLLSPDALTELAKTLQLDVLALPAGDGNDASGFLRTSDHSMSFNLVVSAPTPGHDMLVALIPWLLITGTLFGLFMLLLAKQGLHVADLTQAAATALAASNLALEQQAHIDVVTDLPNRAMFLSRLRKNMILDSRPAHVLFLDLDRFKPVNDCYGHAAGDSVLREVGVRLKACLASDDLAARLGGDEFVILIESRSDAEVETLCGEIIKTVASRMCYAGSAFSIGVSIGVARVPKPCDSIEAILQRADAALYAAKAAGRMRYCFEPAELARAAA